MADKITSTIAKEDDGNIQITFSLPWTVIKEAKNKALEEIAKDATLHGFRKGKAPISKVEKATPKETVTQKTLTGLMPEALADSFAEHKIRPAIYPRLEVLSADEEKSWQVRALTCEVPRVDLGNYKELIKGASKDKVIWTPDKKEGDKDQAPRKEEKQQTVLKVLLNGIKVKIPKILIEEEVNARLSRLLERIEKLGLTLDGYLGSIGKTVEQLREEYQNQVTESLTLDLILDKVGEDQKITIKDSQVNEVIKASAADPTLKGDFDTPEQRGIIASILRRRASLDYLVSLL
jgi:FKBP-type peptidyl-prolyl cis-trans isomerase (trigger factor)